MAHAQALSGLIRRTSRRPVFASKHRHPRAFGRARTQSVVVPARRDRRGAGDMRLFAQTLIGGFWFVSLLIA
jgi:hypothetical protein